MQVAREARIWQRQGSTVWQAQRAGDHRVVVRATWKAAARYAMGR